MNPLELRAARLVMGFTIEDMAERFEVRHDSWRAFEKPTHPGAPAEIVGAVEDALVEFTGRAQEWLAIAEESGEAVLEMYRDGTALLSARPDWPWGARQWTSWVAFCFAQAHAAGLDPRIEME